MCIISNLQKFSPLFLVRFNLAYILFNSNSSGTETYHSLHKTKKVRIKNL